MEGFFFILKYSAWMHITNCMRLVKAKRKKIDAKATWYEKLILLHSVPSN